MVKTPPGQILHTDDKGASGGRMHLLNKWNGEVMSIDQIKGKQMRDAQDKDKEWIVVEPFASTYVLCFHTTHIL